MKTICMRNGIAHGDTENTKSKDYSRILLKKPGGDERCELLSVSVFMNFQS